MELSGLLKKENSYKKEVFEMQDKGENAFFITSVIILSFLVVAIILNSISLEYTKKKCLY